MKKIKIALLGLGNVGRGVWKIFEVNKEEIRKRSGYDVEIAKILVRDMQKARGVEVPNELLTTRSAVISDIISILRSNVDHENDIPVVKNNLWKKKIKDISETVCRYYMRITTLDEPGVLGSLTKAFGDNEVSIRAIIQRCKRRDGQYVILVLETHHTTEGSILHAIDNIYEIKEIDNLIRIEEFR